MGRTQIREVVVDAGPTRPLLFLGVRDTLHVAVVVVGPHKCDVVGHAQSGIVDVERLLVGHKDLRQTLGPLLLVFREYLALLGKDFLQRAGTVLGVCRALHGLVVQTTHAHGVDIIVLSRLTNAVVKLLQYRRAVGLVVPLTVARLVPLRLRGVVEEQRLTVARGDHDAPLVGHLLTLRMAVEGTRTRVHGGGQHITLQTQYQLTHTVVGLRTDVAQFLLIVLCRPRLQSPVLVVDEETAILDAGRLADIVFLVVVDTFVSLVNGHVGKPVPGADADGLTDMQHAIGQTAGIGAGDVELVALSVDGIALPRATQLLMTIRALDSGENHLTPGLSG